jgi:hypothetical protein
LFITIAGQCEVNMETALKKQQATIPIPALETILSYQSTEARKMQHPKEKGKDGERAMLGLSCVLLSCKSKQHGR